MRLSTPSLCLWSPAKPNPTRGSALCVKNDQKRSQPPPPTIPESYDLLHMVYWPYRLGQSEADMKTLLFFENNVGSDWIRVNPGPRGSSDFTVRSRLGSGRNLQGLQRIIYSPARQETNLELDLARKIFLSSIGLVPWGELRLEAVDTGQPCSVVGWIYYYASPRGPRGRDTENFLHGRVLW